MSDDILDEIEKHAKYVLELVEYCKSLEQQVRRYRKYADDIAFVLEPIRKKRESGEPSKSDIQEIRDLAFIKTLYIGGGLA